MRGKSIWWPGSNSLAAAGGPASTTFQSRSQTSSWSMINHSEVIQWTRRNRQFSFCFFLSSMQCILYSISIGLSCAVLYTLNYRVIINTITRIIISLEACCQPGTAACLSALNTNWLGPIDSIMVEGCIWSCVSAWLLAYASTFSAFLVLGVICSLFIQGNAFNMDKHQS